MMAPKCLCLLPARRLVLSLLFVAWLCSSAQAAPRRIRLPHGPGPVFVHAYLNGFRGVARFFLHARRGQRLSLDSVGGGASVVMVSFPHGGQDGAPGGIDDVLLPQTGDYRITVTEHRMGEPWRGRFTLKVRLQ